VKNKSITNFDIDKNFKNTHNVVMQKKNLFVRMWNIFENCFLKNYKCISCFKEIDDKTKFMLCETCAKDMEILHDGLCKKCGDRLNAAGGCINDCSKNRYAFSKNFSFYYYTGSAARIVKNLKYGDHKYLAKYIAEMMLDSIEKFKDFDIITFVPSSKKRLRERGFNQAEEIAKVLGENTDIKVLDLLIKTKDTIHQAGGTQKERLKNLANSFSINDKYLDDIANKSILIVDDVFTTGSTLNECAKTVKKFNPKRIETVTFAKTKFKIMAGTEETIKIWLNSLNFEIVCEIK